MLIILIICLFAFSSCSEKQVIYNNLTSDALNDICPEMFPMSVEECGHKTLFYKPIDGMNIDYSSFDYHYEYCPYPNCEYEAEAKPHSELWSMERRSESYIEDDGYAYHCAWFACTECGKIIEMSIRCKRNVNKCGKCYYSRSYYDMYTWEEWEQIARGEKLMYFEEHPEYDPFADLK